MPAPTRVCTTRDSATVSGAVTARISIALIGTSSAWAPSRSALASTSDTATTRPRLHQVRPASAETATATSTPASTDRTRNIPILTVE
jgi:hypothetical protein